MAKATADRGFSAIQSLLDRVRHEMADLRRELHGPRPQNAKSRRLIKNLAGKTIKEATLQDTEQNDGSLGLFLNFTDGSSFALVSEARPSLELAYYSSPSDNDQELARFE